jgi:hypothetical protein
MFDDLALLRQADTDTLGEAVHLFTPAPAIRLQARVAENPVHQGKNPAAGVVLHYWLPEELPEDAALELVISDAAGEAIRTFTRKPARDDKSEAEGADDDRLLSADAGLNRLEWNMRYPSVKRFDKLVLWNDSLNGPKALPGVYSAALTAGEASWSTEVWIVRDPRSEATPEDLERQFDFVWSINRKLDQTHRAIEKLRQARSDVESIAKRVEGQERYAELEQSAESIVEKLNAIEEALYQTKLEARQDPLNYPIRLNDKLAGVMNIASFGDHPPTASAITVRDELFAVVDEQIGLLDGVLDGDLALFNGRVAALALPAVAVE